ncbi:MAG: class I SAM-dependent methyltransferase [Acidobacteriia bacterium]|nr:class I SAM-dependent methyltransferase [Terriglobia bacterium]
MKPPGISENPAGSYAPRKYWADVAEKFQSADAAGFAPVLHPDAPPWFNQLIDELQFRAIRRALAVAEIPPGARVLDVGCGTGRWVRRYRENGFRAAGIDGQYGMLERARAQRTEAPLLAGDACHLPFADAAFDAVTDITVVQHIAASLQRQALGEMLRVLRPGGRLILMELIRGKDGATLIDWFGQEFVLLDRLFVRMVQSLPGRGMRGASTIAASSEAGPRPMVGARRVYWELRHVTAQLSAWADPLAEKICPARLATHGVFVLRK